MQSKIEIGRQYTAKQLTFAELLVSEIRYHKVEKPQTELGKYGTVGYMGGIGCPHQWWDEHSEAYRKAVENFPRSRHLNTICMLADHLLEDNDRKTD